MGSGKVLDICLADLAEQLRPYMSTGLPDYNLPKTEPMFLDRVVFTLAKPPVDVTAIFTDTLVSGLSGFVLKSVHADTSSQSILLKLTVPSLSSQGHYSMSGQAFVTIDDSNGPYQVLSRIISNVLYSYSTQNPCYLNCFFSPCKPGF